MNFIKADKRVLLVIGGCILVLAIILGCKDQHGVNKFCIAVNKGEKKGIYIIDPTRKDNSGEKVYSDAAYDRYNVIDVFENTIYFVAHSIKNNTYVISKIVNGQESILYEDLQNMEMVRFTDDRQAILFFQTDKRKATRREESLYKYDFITERKTLVYDQEVLPAVGMLVCKNGVIFCVRENNEFRLVMINDGKLQKLSTGALNMFWLKKDEIIAVYTMGKYYEYNLLTGISKFLFKIQADGIIDPEMSRDNKYVLAYRRSNLYADFGGEWPIVFDAHTGKIKLELKEYRRALSCNRPSDVMDGFGGYSARWQ